MLNYVAINLLFGSATLMIVGLMTAWTPIIVHIVPIQIAMF